MTGSHQHGDALLASMEKTIAHKLAVCSAHLFLEEGSVLLDAGCADGQATAYFALKNPGVKVIGVDYDPEYIRQAKEKFGHIPNVEFIEADLRRLDLGAGKLDAIVNLSILHEPFSYTGYRKKTVEEIIDAELKNLKPGGVIINRDFVIPDNPDEMVYLALNPEWDSQSPPDSLEGMSMPDFLKLYSREAMSYDNKDPDGHIKGFFLEEHTDRFKGSDHNIPQGWRVFYLPHHFAWEFIWRMHYRRRFHNESQEKYGFWSAREHRKTPETLGARTTYAADYENPWILENWYAPNARLFDRNMKPLPLPPSNFISVLQKIEPGRSVVLREHRPVEGPARYLQVSSFRNAHNGNTYDMVSRPGGDVVDVLPYFRGEDGELMVYVKADYPRPVINTKPRLMSPNLDRKNWSGHLIEPLAAAHVNGDLEGTARMVLCERGAFKPDSFVLTDDSLGLKYYPAAAELDERVQSLHVEVSEPPRPGEGRSGYSGFSSDGAVRAFNAQSLLNAAQVGMMTEPRLELNIYELMRRKGVAPAPWIGGEVSLSKAHGLAAKSLDDMLADKRKNKVFEPSDESSGWLDVVRSEFHEVALVDGSERTLARQELEFIAPDPRQAKNMSTNSVMMVFLVKDEKTGEPMIGLQKINETGSQYPAIQQREDYSGHVAIPGYRLPSSVEHIQDVPAWAAKRLGVLPSSVKKLGEGYFPSLGVMPNRVFPFVVTEINDAIKEKCDFIPLKEAFQRLEEFEDLHTMMAITRAAHALNLWQDYLPENALQAA